MRPVFHPAVERIQELSVLDRPSEAVQRAYERAVPQGSTLKDLLSGTWLGHPLHAVLTDVVIGAWMSAFFLDVVPTRSARKAADRLVGIGVVAAIPTAASGLSDWTDVGGASRRIGIVHGVGNGVAMWLQARSYIDRKRGRRGRGWLRSATAMGIALGTAYLGGHLAYGKGVGVAQTVFEPWPEEFVPVGDIDSIPEGKLTRVEANGMGILLLRRGTRISAIADRCPHRGCSLSDGTLQGDEVVCACHGSTFRLEDGSLVRGPATVPAPAFEVRQRDGKVEVRLPLPK